MLEFDNLTNQADDKLYKNYSLFLDVEIDKSTNRKKNSLFLYSTCCESKFITFHEVKLWIYLRRILNYYLYYELFIID